VNRLTPGCDKNTELTTEVIDHIEPLYNFNAVD